MHPEHRPLSRVPGALGVIACTLLCVAAVAAQEAATAPASAWAPRSGDAVLDRRLVDINVYAARYPDAFIDELVRYFDVPRTLVVERIAKGGTMPADVYYACGVARVTGRPCRSVLDARAQAPTERWATIAEGLGVAPGSPEAARLQQAITDSYQRWARPLPGPSWTVAPPKAVKARAR